MFVIELKYKVALSVVEAYLQEHRAYLEEYYSSLNFISSGAKVPRTGGVIIARCASKSELMKIIKEDPFYKNNIADYSIIEFKASKGVLTE